MRSVIWFLFASLIVAAVGPAVVAQSFDLPGGLGSPAKRPTTFTDVATFSISTNPTTAARGQVVEVKLTVSPKPGNYTYPTSASTTQLSKNKIVLPTEGDLIFVEPIQDPPGAKEKPGVIEGTDKYYPNEVVWTFKAIVNPSATPGAKSIPLKGTILQACNADNCFYTKASSPPTVTLEVSDAPAIAVPANYVALVTPPAPAPAAPTVTPVSPAPTPTTPETGIVQKSPLPIGEYTLKMDELKSNLVKDSNKLPTNSIWGFLLTAIIWGYVSLATPCVFPMIPITVSLFLKQGNKDTKTVLKLALIYSLTIIAVLGLSAYAFLSVFRELSVNPWMNLFLGGLFIFFALSLFGMYDIALPGFLLRYSEKRRSAGGILGTVFGAIAFSIVSFTCVAPFLGGFAGLASSGQFSTIQLIMGALAFSTAFASPFFLLALFPSLLKQMPRSGGWLDTVKAVMGFLELAAAFKFFRTAEIRMPPVELLTYDFVLAAWVVIAIACGMYLLGFFKLPHDELEPKPVGVTRLIFALCFIGLGVYLAPAMFKTGDGKPQRPSGVVYAWVDAFLLPDSATATGEGLPWNSDLPGALDKVRKDTGTVGTPKYVFVDFTGETCTNCQLNENNIFILPEVREALNRFKLVQLYTDGVPLKFYKTQPIDRNAEAQTNGRFQEESFGTEQLPLYVILEPLADGKVRVVDVYEEGKINDVPGFLKFLARE